MPSHPGHVFVVPGRLDLLDCDDVVVPTDHSVHVTRTWTSTLDWGSAPVRRAERGAVTSLSDQRRVAQLPERTGRRRWLLSVGHGGGDIEALADGLQQCLRAIASTQMLGDRSVRRVGLPTLGVGQGGYGGKRGEVIRALLETATGLAQELGMDVVFVAYNPADYSAFQSERRKAGDMLSAEQETLARALAERAKSGELALFMGAGTSMSAGLPSWNGLLAALAARVDLPFDAAAWDRLGPLDAAELLRRRAADVHHGEEGALGWLVSEIIAPKKRYGLTHVQLAALHCEQAITTNFDHLYEDAVAAVDGRRPLVVLPGGKSRELAGTSSAGWLLKLHGDVSAPASVVLARRSFVTYDAQRRPLGGVLQSTLLTKHLLVVGASMTDDNVIRLIHEVAELGERSHGSATELGTVISLQRDDLRQQIWKPEFAYLALGERNGDVGRAARELEVFLDRVVLLSETGQAHLISERYAPLLGTDAERRAAASARHLHEEIAGLGGEGWSALRAALEQFGADPT